MRFLKGIFVGVLISAFLHMWLFEWGVWSQEVELLPRGNLQESQNAPLSSTQSPIFKQTSGRDKGIYIGMSKQELENLLGEPARREPSLYGYTWWVFNQDWRQYIQVGLQDGVVVTFYTNVPAWGWGELAPGMPMEEWKTLWSAQREISFQHDDGFYTFTLTAQEVQERPLAVEDNLAVQLYIDRHQGQAISGIRVMSLDILLLQRPYALKYRGDLPEEPSISTEEWREIAQANEQQIFELVNVTRELHQLPTFAWHSGVADVARGHSADMWENQYFAHDSAQEGDLKARLGRGEISYLLAGENIAWNYVDAPDAHEGWLNSLGHRQNIFKEEFTHLGVGIVEKYYTQNFITQ